MSPGWQSSTSQMASRVEKRMALIFPVLILDRLTLEMPTCSARWLREIFLSAMTRSRRKMIGMLSPLLQRLVRLGLQHHAVLEDQRQDVNDDSHRVKEEPYVFRIIEKHVSCDTPLTPYG